MPTKEQLAAQTLYANLLHEIKIRIDTINHCTLGFSGLAPPFIKEFCYLQVRMICELVALGCLVAHGDIKQTSSQSLHKQWAADKIMDTLEGLHPHFYPQPIKQTKSGNSHHLQAIETPLSKSDFLKLYHKCGESLHRGSLRKLLTGQFPKQINYTEITEKAQKLINLLSNHVLVMHTGEMMFLAMLANAEDQNNVQVAIAETPKGELFDFTSPNFLKHPPSS